MISNTIVNNTRPASFFSALAVFLLSFCVFVSPSVYSDPYWIFFEKPPAWQPGDPISPRHAADIKETGYQVRTISRYFHGISVEAEAFPEGLRTITGVVDIAPVHRLVREPYAGAGKTAGDAVIAVEDDGHSLSYGVSYRQLHALNIPALHDRGLSGAGVFIGVLDDGFDMGNTTCLETVDIAYRRNFITGGDDVSGNSHGAIVLACLAGAHESKYYGAAFGATFALAVTDDYITETRADEDRWVAAVEWLDSLGVDIISSSLVYNIFDTSKDSYVKNDMDGKTSLVAQAAEIAYSRGIVMVNSAGNEGNNSWHIITTPGDAKHVIAVGSVMVDDSDGFTVSGFSSRGPTADGRIKPDVMAPGDRVYVPYPGSKDFYFSSNGTSLAAPFIAGLCALLKEAHPEWDPATVADALKASCRDQGATGPDNDYGWGVPDAVTAVEYGTTVVLADETDFGDAGRGNGGVETRLIELKHPFPNPFNAAVFIPFSVLRETHVVLEVYDITGRKIQVLHESPALPGNHTIQWNAAGAATGMYVVTLRSGTNRLQSRRLILIK